MAPTPSPPANIHTLLSSLRSPIFQTVHNPQALRTGAKYLRKRLIGPSAIKYYPRQLKLSTLNATVPWNAYGGWRGEGSESWRGEVSASGSGGQRDVWASVPSTSVQEVGSAEVQVQGQEEGEAGKKVRWANQGIMLDRNRITEAGFTEVERIRGAGWVDDARERVRREEVELNRSMGRGPPKKGEGKRSQMKKR